MPDRPPAPLRPRHKLHPMEADQDKARLRGQPPRSTPHRQHRAGRRRLDPQDKTIPAASLLHPQTVRGPRTTAPPVHSGPLPLGAVADRRSVAPPLRDPRSCRQGQPRPLAITSSTSDLVSACLRGPRSGRDPRRGIRWADHPWNLDPPDTDLWEGRWADRWASNKGEYIFYEYM
ncbi:unnamed protein product [Acanthoscelides obtectus]|uniref:Uncharacterized protein n=1 Tax=Acanthoscelides obtectus TaxID=200917 RepID=A0A9P0L0Y1_ACAOB|nr:unnamed protein product [Acanthoscelides obtectus]CAK1676638.1 hypothetical protein AOBTE_LOCUS30874 [Acanthoscelides obtectus]